MPKTIFFEISGLASKIGQIKKKMYFFISNTPYVITNQYTTCLLSRNFSRFFDCLAHPDLIATVATDQK